MKNYAQQSHTELEQMKIEYQQQIAELQLRIPPETPPEEREQRQQDIKASATKISDNMASVAKLLEDSIEAWENLQDHPDVGKIQETIKMRQDELDAVRIEIKTLPPMQKMARVKRSKELQQEIESCRTKVTMLESALQPLVDEALELTNAAESQLKILKTYDNFAQEKADTDSSSVLQEMVEKEKAADEILHNLTSRFQTLAQKIRPPESSLSVPGRATSES